MGASLQRHDTPPAKPKASPIAYALENGTLAPSWHGFGFEAFVGRKLTGGLPAQIFVAEDTMRSTKALLMLLGLVLLSVGGVPSPLTRPHLGALHEFALPTDCGRTGELGGITRGSDGNLWFTELQGNTIGRLTPAGRLAEFTLPTRCGHATGCSPVGITRGPDGNLWFTEEAGGNIGRITPASQMMECALPSCDRHCLPGPFAITNVPDGQLWLTANGNTLGQISPSQEYGVLHTDTPKPQRLWERGGGQPSRTLWGSCGLRHIRMEKRAEGWPSPQARWTGRGPCSFRKRNSCRTGSTLHGEATRKGNFLCASMLRRCYAASP